MMLYSARRRAKRKGVEFSISKEFIEDLLGQGHCSMTGIAFETGTGKGDVHPFTPSLERKDSAQGYTEKNCQLVIFAFNSMKNMWDIETLNKVIAAYLNYQDLDLKTV